MSIIETDTIKHTKDLIADSIASGIDALEGIDFPDVSDVSETITHAASVAATKSGKGVFRTYKTVKKTVQKHPKGSGLTLVAVLALVGAFVWWSRRSAGDDVDSLHVARAA